ncbi:MAG: sulfite exporter TauE/SafE family protein [Patescibacteria group bacterium]
MQSYTFHVGGMHCNSCVALIEHTLRDVAEVSTVRASLAKFNVHVTGDFGDKRVEHIARDLSEPLRPHGYTLSVTQQTHNSKWNEFYYALPIAAVFIIFFIVLQKLGIVNLVTASEVSYSTAFIIGLIASVSTCMAVVGGVVLSMSANFAKEGDAIRPQILFHIGRFVAFFILGGAIGAFGAGLQLGNTGTFLLSMAVALVLLILGINLLDIFPRAKSLQLTLPRWIASHMHALKNVNHILTPLLVGIVTFFLPCGFTQSMQLYTLGVGDFFAGGLLMTAFAAGTFPVLALISFSSLGVHSKLQTGVFYKTAGMIVLFFGIINLLNALMAQGIIPPLYTL